MKKDFFAHKSKEWDSSSKRVATAKEIAMAIIDNVEMKQSDSIADFGAGTGLLGFLLSHKMAKLTAIDNSPSMIEVFQQKASEVSVEIAVIEGDIEDENLQINDKFNGIISSMSMHHVKDISQTLKRFYDMLEVDGYIALADLKTEDGTFHEDNDGVWHFGFDTDKFKKIALEVGFDDVKIIDATTIQKEGKEAFEVFLIVGYKR